MDTRDTWIKRKPSVDNIFMLRYNLIPCTNGFYYFDDLNIPHLGYKEKEKVSRKETRLVDGEFCYKEETPAQEDATDIDVGEEECQFTKYGFEVPDFECEIFKEIDCKKYGIVKDQNEWHTITWNKVGRVLVSSSSLAKFELFNLTPLEKPWYEEESNFPCLMYNEKTKYYFVLNDIDEFSHEFKIDKYRLATEEEKQKLFSLTIH